MAVVRRFGRHALPLVADSIQPPPYGWQSPADDELRAVLEQALDSIEHAASCVGRIEVEDHPFLKQIGAGVLVAPYRFLTSGHAVGRLLQAGGGSTGDVLGPDVRMFLATARAGSRPAWRIPVRQVRFLHPYFDVALCDLAVDPDASADNPSRPEAMHGLQLAAVAPDPVAGRRVGVVGFVATDPREEPVVAGRIFGSPLSENLYLMPGELLEPAIDGSVPQLRHDCSTMGGSSGAPLLDLETGTSWESIGAGSPACTTSRCPPGCSHGMHASGGRGSGSPTIPIGCTCGPSPT